MRNHPLRLTLALAATLAIVSAGAGLAQGIGIGQNQNLGLYLPNASPGAQVAQTVGLTNIEIVYHRPSVNERPVFGALVPYGQVWRTGANENTIISFSTDVTVQGEPLAAGTYGLHSIPGESEWEIIFSNDTTAWGSFAYDEANDALRVTAKPMSAPHQEQLAFGFRDVTTDSAEISLRWAETEVPILIETNTNEIALASIKEQLKGLAQFNWVGWNQAAGWCNANDLNLEEALQWADNSIGAEARFENHQTKSLILGKLGREDEAAEIMTTALDMANAGQLHNYGRQLLAQGQNDEAMKVFQRNADENPDTWFIGVGLARGYAAQGEFDQAAEAMRDALARAPENQKAYIQGLVSQLEQGQNI